MKGFPNQVSDLEVLSLAIKITDEIQTQGKNPKNDDVLGEALIRGRVLGTGHTNIPIDEYLAKQRAKNLSDQSHRTRARGLRELFRVLELIEDTGSGIELTDYGHQISSFAGKDLDGNALRVWRMVVRNMTHDGGDEETSHPYQVLLRLIARKPGIRRSKCALALEARNDSETELNRITGLADMSEFEIRNHLGITQSNWDNAKKILPSFAEQLGDVDRKNMQTLYIADTLSSPKAQVNEPQPTTELGLRPPRSSSQVTSESIATTGITSEWDEADELIGAPDIERLRISRETIRDRLRRHNLIVRALADQIGSGAELYENPFDCLACFTNTALLIEVKSLDGTAPDEAKRVREALAQLLYYESFVTQPVTASQVIILVAGFEHRPSSEHITWLECKDVAVIWQITGGSFDGTDTSRRKLAGHFGF